MLPTIAYETHAERARALRAAELRRLWSEFRRWIARPVSARGGRRQPAQGCAA